MRSSSIPWILAAALAVLSVGLWLRGGGESRAASDDSDGSGLRSLETRRPVPPQRTTLGRAGPEAPPEEPASAPGAPFTATVVERFTGGGSARESRDVVVRTADRFYRAPAAGGPEWLFRRNPVNPSHASAACVDHELETILGYGNSDLREIGLAAPWERRALLGLDAGEVEALVSDGARETAFGLEFERRAPAAGAPAEGVAEVWWNAEHRIPRRIAARGPGWERTVEIVELRLEADASLLAEPRLRFPKYESMDVVDFRESHRAHDHGGAKDRGKAGR